MNKYVHSETQQHVMKLIQIGADVNVIRSNMVYVSFILENGVEVSYVYNINKKNRYFLERIKPYPVAVKEFESPDDVVNIILLDYKQFKIAVKSKKIKNFIEINNSLHKTIKAFEDLFLYYNISRPDITEMEKHVQEMNALIKRINMESERLFFEKEPENL